MNKIMLSMGMAVAALSLFAKDYHQGFWSMGYNPTANLMHLIPGEAVYVTTAKTLAFAGATLEDVENCEFFGSGGGTWLGNDEVRYGKARNVQKHRDANGKLDLIVFVLPFRYAPKGTLVKSVTIALENSANGDGVVAYVPDGNDSVRYASGTSASDEDYKFVTLKEDGTRSYQGTRGTLATSPTANGYGVAGLSAAFVVPKATPGLVFKDCTLEDIRNHSFHGISIGAYVGHLGLAIGCNKAVFTDATGKATKIRVEMQTVDHTASSVSKCVVIELTDGEGGVYAQSVAARYTTETGSYGYKFVNANGTYAGIAGTPSTGYPDAGYGICGLTATEVPTSAPFTGFLCSTNKVLWQSQQLDRFVDFPGIHHGAWVRALPATSRFYLRMGRGAETKLEFESMSAMNEQVRSGTVMLEQAGNDIVGRVIKFAYGPGAPDGLASYLNGGTEAPTATSQTEIGYGLRDLEGRALEPVFTATGDVAAWSGLDWDYAPNSNALAEATLTGPTFDFDMPVTAGMVRINAESNLTLTATGASFATRYLDLTDAKGTTTLAFALTNTSITAGRDTVFAVAPTNCALSVAAGNRMTLRTPADLAACGLHARGRIKFTGDFDLSDPLGKDFATVESVEFAGTHVLTGWFVNDPDVGFHWSNPGKLVISGKVTLSAGDDGKRGDFCIATANDPTPGGFVVVEGGSLVCVDRTRIPSLNKQNGRGALAIEGGLITGGWLYFNTEQGQALNIRVDGGRFETGICPWTEFQCQTKFQLVQTSGTFAPNTLQPLSQGHFNYNSVNAAYTFKGGVFEPPAGWDAAYPWLPITVPAEGDATIRIVRDALIPSALNVMEGARLSVESTNAASTLTLASFTTAGTLAITGNVPARLSFGGTVSPSALEIAEGATFVKAGAGTLALASALTAETAPGSLAVEGGTILLSSVPAAIGGALTLAADTKLVLDAGLQPLTEGGPVFTAAGGITVPEGVDINDLVTVTAGRVELNDDRTQLLFHADMKKPIVAVWTGLGNRALASDPMNWSCTNVLGQAIAPESGVVPNALTTVFVTGATSFNLPAGQSIACRELVIHGAITLTDDCDWCGLGTVKFAEGCTLELAGHRLDVCGFDCPVAGAATITNMMPGEGELHVVVPEGQTFDKAAVAVTGNLKLFKEGAGIFIPAKTGHTYMGGTEIVGGTLRTVPDNGVSIGGGGGEVSVHSGATLELTNPYYANRITLAGGTLRNTSAESGHNIAQLASVRLTDDSSIDVVGSFGLIGYGYSSAMLDLGTHELTINIPEGKNFWFDNVDVTAGKLKVTGKGTFAINSTSLRGSEADFDFSCAKVTAAVDCDVKSWTVGANTTVSGNGIVTVRGTYRPLGDSVSECRLRILDGVTIDLAGCTATFDMKDKVAFEDGAAVYVDTGSRKFKNFDYVATWTEPANRPTLSFKAKGGAACSFFDDEHGIRICKGLTLLIR